MVYLTAALKPLSEEETELSRRETGTPVRGNRILVSCSFPLGSDFGPWQKYIVSGSERLAILEREKEREERRKRGFEIFYFEIRNGKFIPVKFEVKNGTGQDSNDNFYEGVIKGRELYSVFVHITGGVDIAKICIVEKSNTKTTKLSRRLTILSDDPEVVKEFLEREKLALPSNILFDLAIYVIFLKKVIQKEDESGIDDEIEVGDGNKKLFLVPEGVGL